MTADWTAALDRLKQSRGRRFWRSLDELVDSPDFRERIASEFPSLAPPDLNRRDLLRCLGASLALSGLAGCDAVPDERALPYVRQPETVVPGNPDFYATAVTLAGYAQPVIGTTHGGRPTKLEGNPDHPASRGRSTAFTQAEILNLYDPDRSSAPRHMGEVAEWRSFDAAAVSHAALLDSTGGEGFRLLTGNVTSPTLARQIDAMLARWPGAIWHAHELAGGDRPRHLAARQAFGRPLDRQLRLDRAWVSVFFSDDPLGAGPAQLLNALRWQQRRSAFQRGDGLARMFVAEPTPTLTGAKADERLAAAPSRIPALIVGLAAALGVDSGIEPPPLGPRERQWLRTAANALRGNRGRGLVAAGPDQPPEIQLLAMRIDVALGNLARTSTFTEPVSAAVDAQPIEPLIADMAAGRVRSLAILETNPAYAVPGFAEAMRRVPLCIHMGLHFDETARRCQWHASAAHELESWSDARAVEGTASIIQPLVRPFLAVRSRHQLVAALAGDIEASDLALVRQTWQELWGDIEPRWRETLVAGFVEGSSAEEVPVAAPVPSAMPARVAEAQGPLELVIRPDPALWDGRFANNPWMQELPKPFTTLTWDNAVLISPAFAARRGLRNGNMVRVGNGSRAIVGPIWVLPGQAERVVLLHLGGGRSHAGRVAEGAGYSATPLLGAAAVEIEATGEDYPLANVQHEFEIGGEHPPVHVTGLLDTAPDRPEQLPGTFYPDEPRGEPQWAMSIDLDLCIGCNACVTACDAENNIPMVGKEEVANGREMHWMRVDRYFEGSPEAPNFHMQPVPCMHCEDAPCEMGCPVNAAVHSPDGLNLQVYNRCIGTRTCSSFCPYKVRHFNWFNYTKDDPPELQAQRNPNVTVRAKGVMEKCTYCIQRISAARIAAKIDGRPIRDGEVQTACQQACPTKAIVFGDITDRASQVTGRKRSPRDYVLLEEANTRPRTTYLARIRRDEDGNG